MLGFSPLSFPPPLFSFPPQKRGPRSRGGAAATARTSAQRIFRRHDARVHAPSFPPQKRGPRNRDGAAATARASTQRAFRRRGVRASLKRQRPPCRGGCGGPMSFWLPPNAPWSLDPGVRRENDERSAPVQSSFTFLAGFSRAFLVSPALSLRFPRKSGGPGAAVAPLLQIGPQRSGRYAGAVCGLL